MRTRVKICGITHPQDAIAAVDAGADAIGMVFWMGSRRAIDAGQARAIRDVVPPHVALVGVFVDPTTTQIKQVATETGITTAQLCGVVSPNGWQELAQELKLLRAIAVGGANGCADSLRIDGVSDYLLDNGSSGRPGGTGEPFDWRAVDAVRSWGRIWVAGGLDAGNVGDAIRITRPHAVDVSSGVEESPGIKSAERIGAFIAAVREADASCGESAL